MSVAPGQTIGVYQVGEQIGEGGMGQVYQARDTSLDRDVALKVLPPLFTDDPERLARFEREAKTLASLNHPNIGQIYGIAETDDTRALVLELIEGPTLADRISQGPVPIDDALSIANQIADALEAAHEQGIIHRDLKPANVKVKDDGTVKVLDFGLAKAFAPDASSADLAASPTISLTAAATQMGMIIGTAAYMAPEQAKGKPVDKRADIWAFGALLFEMLTARKPFPGEDVSEVLATVIKSDPDWDQLPDDTPPRVQQVLGACLSPGHRRRQPGAGPTRNRGGGSGGRPDERRHALRRQSRWRAVPVDRREPDRRRRAAAAVQHGAELVRGVEGAGASAMSSRATHTAARLRASGFRLQALERARESVGRDFSPAGSGDRRG